MVQIFRRSSWTRSTVYWLPNKDRISTWRLHGNTITNKRSSYLNDSTVCRNVNNSRSDSLSEDPTNRIPICNSGLSTTLRYIKKGRRLARLQLWLTTHFREVDLWFLARGSLLLITAYQDSRLKRSAVCIALEVQYGILAFLPRAGTQPAISLCLAGCIRTDSLQFYNFLQVERLRRNSRRTWILLKQNFFRVLLSGNKASLNSPLWA